MRLSTATHAASWKILAAQTYLMPPAVRSPSVRFYFYPDGPDKTQQLASDRGHHLPFFLAPCRQLPIARVQPMLRLPRDLLDLLADRLLALAQSATTGR